jgi:quercetin dioxygenase-like cupin family protein
MTVRIPRTYADAEGESHFDTAEDALSPTAFVPTNPPFALSAPHPATAAVFCRLAPGWDGSWHPTPRTQYAVTLAGELEITVTDGERRRFGPGDLVLLDDRTGRGHSTVVVGEGDVLVLLVWLAQDI